MPSTRFLLLPVLALAAGAAQAVDTPGEIPNRPSVSLEQRLANARKAIDRKDWSTATRELNDAVRADPRSADVHNLLGYSYRKRATPDMAKAYEHYQTALKIDPRHKGAHEYIGEAYLMDRRLAEAEKHLAELEKICGSTACEEYQDLAKAIAEYRARN